MCNFVALFLQNKTQIKNKKKTYFLKMYFLIRLATVVTILALKGGRRKRWVMHQSQETNYIIIIILPIGTQVFFIVVVVGIVLLVLCCWCCSCFNCNDTRQKWTLIEIQKIKIISFESFPRLSTSLLL